MLVSEAVATPHAPLRDTRKSRESTFSDIQTPGYTVDRYARINEIAAVVTTFGVGELSAINASRSSIPLIFTRTPLKSDIWSIQECEW